MESLQQLALLLERQRQALLASWRQQVRQLPSAAHLDTPTLNDHVPALIDEMITALKLVADESIPEAILDASPSFHGTQRFQVGFDIVEVVAEYNILRGCIHDLAEGYGMPLKGKAFHILNRVLDTAIGQAVETYATEQALEVQRRRDAHLAFVAHDLRTPLNAIALATRVLHRLSDQPDNETVKQMLISLERNVRQLESLVDDVLKESTNIRTESGVTLERRHFDLWPVVEALIHDLRPVAGTASTHLTNQIPLELTAWADAGLVRRIIQNLIANAIRHTPRGDVTIGARRMEDGGVECWVSDTGSGIAADQIATLFQPAEPDGSNGKAGLGLTIVKSFVEAHSGALSVESTVGEGTTFRFTLPRKNQSTRG